MAAATIASRVSWGRRGGAGALSAAAWSLGSLVAFRAVQGLGGGLLLPVGQMMLAQAAGQERMGRAMALLSPGLAALIHGLSEVGAGASPLHPALWLGAALVAAFVARSLRRSGTQRVPEPSGPRRSPAPSGAPGALLELRLFGDRGFAAAVGALVCHSAAMFGFTVLVPLHSQLAEGGSALDAGLLLAPMGIGAAITMPLAGRLTDSRGPRGAGAAGVVLAVAGIAAFVLFGGGLVPMFVVGLGHGLVSTSVMAAAFRTLARAEIPAATTLSTIAVRLAAPFGVALPAVLLQALTRAGAERPFTYAFWTATALAAVSLVPIALLGSKTWSRSSSAPA